MRFFDLHCDTLYRILEENQNIYSNTFHVDISRTSKYKPYIGCHAIFIPDEYRGQNALDLFNRAYKQLCLQEEKFNKYIKVCKNSLDIKNINEDHIKQGIIFTVEGGAALAGNINNVKHLYNLGVKIMTLTWNGSCEIGDGVGVENSRGLSKFGASVIKEMENYGIIVDISHASEKLFYDVSQVASKPFIATHSNAKYICPHRRNLTDEQFKVIKSSGGIVGITFAKDFLSQKDASLTDIIKHIEHFLSLSGENTVSIGSDFDGTNMPKGIDGIESIYSLYEQMLKLNYNESLIDKIFYKNAYNFIINNIK